MPSYGFDVNLLPAGTVATASGNGAGIEVEGRSEFRGSCAVTTASGTTPSLTVSVQTSHDNGASDAWRTVGSFPAQTATGATAWQSFAGIDRFIRASWVISGTNPSLTFGVTGEAV